MSMCIFDDLEITVPIRKVNLLFQINYLYLDCFLYDAKWFGPSFVLGERSPSFVLGERKVHKE